MLHRTTHPTTLSLLMNAGIIASVTTAVILTKDLTALIGLAFIRDLPYVPEELNVRVAEIQGMQKDEEDDEQLYKQNKVGFVPSD